MQIVTVVGARPQFIKAAAVSRKLREEHEEILIHTGQHYDSNMSEIFFRELQIPAPDFNLGVGSGTPARQTAEMMIGIEDILLQKKPDYLLVYGDTNSTLAGALAASKLHIPIIHVEAGLRSFNRGMPEEINRILTDHLSSLLLCPTNTAVQCLAKEGITKDVYHIGDVMYDALLFYTKQMEGKNHDFWLSKLHCLNGGIQDGSKWYIATIHRAENTDLPEKISEILRALEQLNYPVIFPVHPRIRTTVCGLCRENQYRNIILAEPLGYMDMLYFTKNAVKVITDSGGLQKEAYILGTPCVTIREETEWRETLIGNCNILAHPQAEDIYRKVLYTETDNTNRSKPYGDGNAADHLCKLLREKSR